MDQIRKGMDEGLARLLAYQTEKTDKHWKLYLPAARAWLQSWQIRYWE